MRKKILRYVNLEICKSQDSRIVVSDGPKPLTSYRVLFTPSSLQSIFAFLP